MFRRVLSLILCVCMMVSMMPTWSFTALAEGEEAIVEIVVAEPEEEKEEEPTHEPVKEPEAEEPAEEPEAEEPAEEPVAEEPAEEPVAEEPAEEPVAEEPAEEPVAEEPAEEPVAEEPAEEPVAEEPAEEPVAEEPVAEEPAEEPVIEEPAEEPTEEPAEEPVEEPAEEVEAEARFAQGYAYVKAGEEVYDSEELDTVLGVFAEKAVVYVSDREETEDEDQDVLTLRFACEGELVKGYIAAKHVKLLTEEEAAAYAQEAAEGVRVEDGVYLLNEEFALEEEEETESPEAEEPAEDETEEPEIDMPVIEDLEDAVVEDSEADEEEDEDEDAEQAPSGLIGGGATAAECAHTHTYEEPNVERYDDETAVDLGDGTHRVDIEIITIVFCSDCGNAIDWIQTRDFEPTVEPHHFYGEAGEVCICGAVSTGCAHEHTELHQNVYAYDTIHAVDNGDGTHTVEMSIRNSLYCEDCNREIEYETIVPEKIVTEPHDFFPGEDACWICGAEIAVATPDEPVEVTVSAAQDYSADMQVILYWWAGRQQPEGTKYNVYDGTKLVATTAETSYVHKKVTAGVHVYYVAPVLDGVEGPMSEGAAVNVESIAWMSVQPKLSGAKQITTTAEGQVELKWTHKPQADYYVILEEGAANAGARSKSEMFAAGTAAEIEAVSKSEDAYGAIASTVDLTIILEDQAPGVHTYKVVPVKAGLDALGQPIMGIPSAPKSVTVKPLWDVKPTLSVAKQDTASGEEGLVMISFKRGKGLTKGYVLRDECSVYEDGVLDFYVMTDDAAVSFTLEGVPAGTHKYTLYPAVIEDDELVEMGTQASAAKSVKVASLWDKKPTLSVAKQLTDVEGAVQLTWKRPSNATYAYKIHDSYLNGYVQTYDFNLNEYVDVVVWTDDATVNYVVGYESDENEMRIPVEADAHGYTIVPVAEMYDEETDEFYYVEGTMKSATKKLKVAELWNKKPTLKTAVQGTGDADYVSVNLTWTSGSDLTRKFAIFDNGEIIADESGSPYVFVGTSATLKLPAETAAGAHSFTVAPVKVDVYGYPAFDDDGNLVTGLASAAKKITIKVASWKDAPTLTAVQTGEGVVTLTWTSLIEADGYAVYEVVGKQEVMLNDGVYVEGDHELVIENVESSQKGVKHSYVVQPVNMSVNPVEPGAKSKAATVTVKDLWNAQPVITTAVQMATSDRVVYLEWAPGSNVTELYQVFVKNDPYTDVISDTSVEIPVSKTGSYAFTVKPVREVNGVYEYGTASKPASVKVADLWDKKPVVKSAAQLTHADGVVEIVWDPATDVWEAFKLTHTFGKTVTVIADEDTNWYEYYDEETGLFTYVVEDDSLIVKGANKFAVIPMHYDSTAGEWEEGAPSSAKSVSVKELWNLKPTLISAVQGTEEEGQIIVSFKAGSTPNLADGFVVTVNGEAYESVSGESGVNYTTDVYVSGAGNYKIAVQPFKMINGEQVLGLASAPKSVKLVDLWKAKPTINEVLRITDSMAGIIFEAGCDYDLTHDFRLLINGIDAGDRFSYSYYDGLFNGTVTGLEAGKAYKLAIQPVYGSEYGTASSIVDYKVQEVNWAEAPNLYSAKQLNIREIELVWMNAAGQDVEGVEYEVLALNPSTHLYEHVVTTEDTMYLVPVENSGTYSYRVRAIKDGVAGAFSATKSVKFVGVEDLKVTGLTAVVENGETTLTWNPVAMASGYLVTEHYYSEDGGSSSSQPAYVETASYTNANTKYIEEEMSITFEVVPVFEYTMGEVIGESDEEICIIYGREITLEAQYNVYAGGVELLWEMNDGYGVKNYRIYRMEHGVDEELELLTGVDSATGGYIDTTAKIGSTYTYVVIANTEYGETARSEAVQLTPEYPQLPDVEGLSAYWYDLDTICLTWDEAGYYYDVAVKTEDGFEYLTTTVSNICYLDVANAKPVDGVYTFSVSTVEEVRPGLTLYGEPAMVSIAPLTATVLTRAEFVPAQGGVQLEWTKVDEPGVIGYGIIRDGSYVGEQLSADETQYLDTDVELGKTYNYAIMTIYEDGEVSSNSMKVMLNRLTAPANLESWNYDNWIYLDWSEVPNAQAYNVEVYDEATGEWKFVETVTERESDMGMWISERDVFEFGKSYKFRVYATLQLGEKTAQGPASEVGVNIRQRPVFTSAEYKLSKGGVVLKWEKPADITGILGYNIMKNGRTLFEDENVQLPDSNVTEWLDKDVVLGETYRYDIAIVYDGGEVSSENTIVVTPKGLDALEVNTAIYFVEANNDQTDDITTLFWNKVEGVEDFCYEIRVKNAAGEYEAMDVECGYNPRTGEWLAEVPQANDVAEYLILGYVEIEGGGRVYTPVADSSKLTVARKSAISDLAISVDDSGDATAVILDWAHDEATTGYNIERAEGSGEFAHIGGTPDSGRTYTDATVIAEKTYTYKVTAQYTADEIKGYVTTTTAPVKVALYDYELNSAKNEATIIGYKGTSGKNLVIPASVEENGKTIPVVAVGKTAPSDDNPDTAISFATNVPLTGSLTISEGIKMIGAYAFVDQSGLTSLSLASTVTEIGAQAFGHCGFTNVVIPETVKKVWNGAFNASSTLLSFEVKGADTVLEAGILNSCRNLTTVILPEGMTTIPAVFVKSCKALESFVIPASVVSLGEIAFMDSGLKTLTILGNTGITAEMLDGAAIPEGCTIVTELFSNAHAFALANGYDVDAQEAVKDGVKYAMSEDGESLVVTGAEVNTITTLTVPEVIGGMTVKAIGESAFEGFAALTSVDLPDTVEVIGKAAFKNCTALSSMN